MNEQEQINKASLERTFALPCETVKEFEEIVTPEQRSTVISELLREWLAQHQHHAQLRQEILAGCDDMADVYLETEQAYHAAEEELHHALS